MRHRVLIVSPHFPPINAPDHQRIRMSLPYLEHFGWEAAVLAVRPSSVEGGTVDPLLAQTIPANVPIIRVGAFPIKATRRFGMGNLALRALPFLWQAGSRLLSKKNFDLVYFSTTQFPVLILGPLWKKRFGIPYVVDFQDPWLDHYYTSTGRTPPGGKTKYGLSKRLATLLEPKVMRKVSQVLCVSPAYVEALLKEYPHLRWDQFTVLPFSAAEEDFEILPSLGITQNVFDPTDSKLHWVYVGAAGVQMRPALKLLFSALQQLRLRVPEIWKNVRLHFVGTSYAPTGSGTVTVLPVAAECGVSDLVDERTDRAPYFQGLELLVESNGILIVGSDSPSYNPSKLYSCILARRPMLSIVHEESPAVEILRRCQAGAVITFAPGSPNGNTFSRMASALEQFREQSEKRIVPKIDWNEYEQYTARAMSRRQCRVFDRATCTH